MFLYMAETDVVAGLAWFDQRSRSSLPVLRTLCLRHTKLIISPKLKHEVNLKSKL